MHINVGAALLAFASVASAATKGFNYGSTFTNNAPKRQADFEADFNQAKGLQGAPGFNSARLYTMIQAGTQSTPIEAIQAAINTQTHLLLGLWASGGDQAFTYELDALIKAIDQYGTAFISLIDGISVGSEDLYRISPTGRANGSNPGAGPEVIVRYIKQLKARIANTAASQVRVGHVDTYTAFIDPANRDVASNCSFIGMDAYPYYQYQSPLANTIDNGKVLFFSAYEQTLANAYGAEVWVTESGWPVSGANVGSAVASIPNARTYWDQVGCALFQRNIRTWWYTLQDAEPDTPSPSFGLVGAAGGETPLYDLTCPPNAGASIPTTSIPASEGAAGATGRPAQSNPPGGNAGDAPAPTSVPSSGQSNGSGSNSGGAAPAPSDEEETVTHTSMVTVSSCPTCPAPSGGSGGSGGSAGSAPAPAPAPSVTSALPSGGSSRGSSGGSSGGSGGSTATYGGKSTAAQPAPSSGAGTPAPCPSASSGKSCPADLSGTYEFPHLIIPVDSSKPDTALGTSYNGKFTSSVSSLFNFDIPSSDAGKTCSLVFLLPTQADLETSSFTLNSPGGLDVKGLSEPASEQTSYSNVPKSSSDLGSIGSVEAGHTYVISSFSCPAGSRIGFQATGTNGLDLDYFQDYNPSPIGMYITVC